MLVGRDADRAVAMGRLLSAYAARDAPIPPGQLAATRATGVLCDAISGAAVRLCDAASLVATAGPAARLASP